jgi:hypothetical protein
MGVVYSYFSDKIYSFVLTNKHINITNIDEFENEFDFKDSFDSFNDARFYEEAVEINLKLNYQN